jgi:hypothetical protein
MSGKAVIFDKINWYSIFLFLSYFLIKIYFMVSKLDLKTYMIVFFSKQMLEFGFSNNIIVLLWWY